MNDELRQIMLVEEDETLAEITSFRLELLGYGVNVVASGEAAIASLEQQIPDVIIVDLVLPKMTGHELIERLARQESTSKVAIMALSIEADLDAVLLAYKVGALDYLVAPYNPTVLEDKVAKLMERAGQSRLAETS